MLNPDPIKRISLKEAMEHPWVNEGYASLLKPFPYPNKPTEDQVNPTILRYMNTNMEFNLNEITENIKLNKPSSSLATYYLLLNKVKSMLMKIDPKKDKLKQPRTGNNNETKPVVVAAKDLNKQQTTSVPSSGIAKQQTSTNTSSAQQQQQQQILPVIPSSQSSPMTRATKTAGANTVSASTAISNGYGVVRNSAKPDLSTKYQTSKPLDRTLSPMPVSSTGESNTTTNQPSSAFAGAIKSLTQKYKTMHLTTSIDTSTLANHHHTAPTTPTNINYNNNSNNNSTFTYKNNYLNHSLDHAFNTPGKSVEVSTNLNTQNSDSISSADDRQHVFNKNRASATKQQNINANTEWTQMIKLPNGKTTTKSDMNNNDLMPPSNNNNNNHEVSSLIHLSHNHTTSNSNNASTGSSLHMPILSYNNNSNSSSNTNSVQVTTAPSRSAKSPVIKKISSPINLPSIEASLGRSTPQ